MSVQGKISGIPIPMGIPTFCAPWVYLPPVYLPLERTWNQEHPLERTLDQGYLPPGKDMGPEIPSTPAPAPAPMDSHSPVKTLHSHFIGGW